MKLELSQSSQSFLTSYRGSCVLKQSYIKLWPNQPYHRRVALFNFSGNLTLLNSFKGPNYRRHKVILKDWWIQEWGLLAFLVLLLYVKCSQVVARVSVVALWERACFVNYPNSGNPGLVTAWALAPEWIISSEWRSTLPSLDPLLVDPFIRIHAPFIADFQTMVRPTASE